MENKEELKTLWEQEPKEEAEKFPEEWIAKAMVSKMRSLKKFTKALSDHIRRIFTCYDI